MPTSSMKLVVHATEYGRFIKEGSPSLIKQFHQDKK